MKGQKLFCSSNGYDHLQSYTTKLYGERGTFQHNLQRYISGEEFASKCRQPRGIDDIPEISFEEIKGQICREQHFQDLSAHVARLYSERVSEKSITREDEYACAGVLGLCPGRCDWYETLFPHLVDLFVTSETEGKAILDSVERYPNIVSVMVSAMMDGIRDHQIINVNGRDILAKGYARNYFRGESAYYGESRPSLFRNLPKDSEKKILHIVIGNIRMNDFSLWLKKLSFVRNWPYGSVLYGAVAQHYGIPTNGMDITSDIKTALFFACCRYEKGKWRPLHNDEFAEVDSRKSIAAKGGDSRFGILFAAPIDVANMSKAANIPSLHFTYGTPLGYQPFMRCASQSGFIIEADESYNMYQDISFQKVKFRHTEEICDWIYHEMHEGALIYPNESFGVCDDIVETIMNSHCFTEDAFEMTLRHLHIEDREQEIRKLLVQQKYELVSEVAWCTEARMQELEDNWRRHVASNPQLQEIPKFRIGFYL